MVNSRKCKDKKRTKKCEKLLKKKKCKKKKVWKKCLKTCGKCDDSGTPISGQTQFTTKTLSLIFTQNTIPLVIVT